MKTSFAVLMLFLSGTNQVQLSHKNQAKQDGEHLYDPEVFIDMEEEAVQEIDDAAHANEAALITELENLDDQFGDPVPKGAIEQGATEGMAMLDWANTENKAQRPLEVAGVKQFDNEAIDFAKRSEGKGDIEFAQTHSKAHRKLASRFAQLRAQQPGPMEFCKNFRSMLEDAERELSNPGFGEEMQRQEDQAEHQLQNQAPFPPAAEVDQALQGLVQELLRATDNLDECAGFLGHLISEVERQLKELHQAIAPDCHPQDMDCVLKSLLGKLKEAHEHGAFDGPIAELSHLAERSGHNVSPDEINMEFLQGFQGAEEFGNDVHMDPQAEKWEEEGEHEVESDWEEWEKNRCPCDKGTFCNNDDGPGKGFCEPCGRHQTPADCMNDGLPELGAMDCQQKCF